MLKAFRVILEGSQEVPPTTSTATGLGTVIFDTAAVAAYYSFRIQGLDFGLARGGPAQTPSTTDDATRSHFHNAARGANGSIVFGQIDPEHDADDVAVVLNADGSWTVSGRWETTDLLAPQPITNFAAALGSAAIGTEVPLYFNIHTAPNPGGAIRGQLVASADFNLHRNDFNGDFQGDLLLQNVNTGAVRLLLKDNNPGNLTGFSDSQVGGGGNINWKIISGGGDFNADGTNDILWQHTNGAVTLWLVNGTTFTQTGLIGGGGDANWRSIASGDFNGDNLSDVVWQNSVTGAVTIWQKNGAADPTNFSQFSNVGGPGSPGWKVTTTGDFNQDGRSDLLWQHDNGAVTIWLMNGANSFTQTGLIGGSGNPNWRIIATGELNGDGAKNDLLWQHTNGAVTIWERDNTANPEGFQQFSLLGGDGDPNWRIKGTEDINRDGLSDVLFQNVNNGNVVEWLMNGATNFTQTGVVPATAAGNDAAWQLIGVA